MIDRADVLLNIDGSSVQKRSCIDFIFIYV